MRLGSADHRRPRCAAYELTPRPASDELVSRGVDVPDEGDVLGVHGEEVKLPWLRPPTQPGRNLVGVPALHRRVVFRARSPTHLELAVATIATGDDTVHQDPRIASQIGRLGRAPQHRQPEIPIHHPRLHRTDTGRAITPNSPDEHNTRPEQPSTSHFGQPRLTRLQLHPPHDSSTHQPRQTIHQFWLPPPTDTSSTTAGQTLPTGHNGTALRMRGRHGGVSSDHGRPTSHARPPSRLPIGCRAQAGQVAVDRRTQSDMLGHSRAAPDPRFRRSGPVWCWVAGAGFEPA